MNPEALSLEPGASIRVSRGASARPPAPSNDDGVGKALCQGGKTPELAPCRRNPESVAKGLGRRSAAQRGRGDR